MDRLQSMRVFCKVVEAGSFSKAAQLLDITSPVVTRLVADLERHLAARLLNRTTRSLSLTEAGREYYNSCQQILEEIDEAESRLHERSGQFGGNLRILGGTAARAFIVPVLAEYQRRFPAVTLEFSFGDSTANMVDEGYDLAVMPEQLGIPSTLVARRLVNAPLILCAAPSYLAARGVPQCPADLKDHACLTFDYRALRTQWTLQRKGKSMVVPIKSAMVSNSVDVLLLAASEGMGIFTAARTLITEDLRSGRLVQVLPGYHVGQVDWYVIYPSRKFVLAKVRALIDMLTAVAATVQHDINSALAAVDEP